MMKLFWVSVGVGVRAFREVVPWLKAVAVEPLSAVQSVRIVARSLPLVSKTFLSVDDCKSDSSIRKIDIRDRRPGEKK